MPLSGSAFWAVVLPVEKTNLITNPSFERGTTGWGTIQAGTVGTTSDVQAFGAWSGSVAPTSNGTAGAKSPTWTAGNGTAYTVSAYVRGANGIPYRMAVADSAGINFVSGGTMTFTGGGTIHRYSLSYSEASGATRTIVLTKDASADTSAFYVDGLQVEVGSLTTYLDGDQDGCYWIGDPHNSPSGRSGTYRGGGSVVALADLGLKPNDTPGIGMPPLEVTSQSYALLPGAEYQRSRAGERPFTLTFQPIMGTTQKDFHATRRTLIDAFKPDLLDPQQPSRFWFTGGQGTVQLDAVYAGGLELGGMDGPMAEEGAVKFIAHDPYWYAVTDQGTALAPQTALGSTKFIAARDGLGRWGTLGNAGTTTNDAIAALAYKNGTLYVGGRFSQAGGTTSGALAFWLPSASRWGTFGGTVDATGGIMDLSVTPDGTLVIAGNYGHISGVANTRFFGRYSGGFGTLTGGTPNAFVESTAWSSGTLFMGGNFTNVPGTSRFFAVGFWTRSGYGSLTGGTVDAAVTGVTVGLNKVLYIAGPTVTVAGGTTVNKAAQWNGAWGSVGSGFTGTGGGAYSLATGPNGLVYAVGGFGSASGGSAQNCAYWNGVQWFPMGGGLGTLESGVTSVLSIFADQQTGDVYGAGPFHPISGPRKLPDALARWNSYTWLPLDIDWQSGYADTFLKTPDGTIYIAGTLTGTAQVASVAQIVNVGRAETYPVFKARNTSASGTARIYQLANTLTGDALYFDLTIQPGEEITLIAEPGNRAFTSDFAGNIFPTIIPGSNLTGFRLMPGTNYVSFFADSSSVAASIYWRPKSWSADGGTVY